MQTGPSSDESPRRPRRRARGALKLNAELGLADAAQLRGELAARRADAAPVRLDAGEVARIHTAAMQLFCLFCSDRRSAGREVEFLRPSPALRQAAALLGATTLLNLARTRA